MTSRLTVGAADDSLDKLLSQELDVHVPGAPGFYERQGYREIFRWDGVPVEGEADVHLRKDL